MCEGWVVFGKKQEKYSDVVKGSFAINSSKGKGSLQCSVSSFDGADPNPDADSKDSDYSCWCD